MEGSVCIRKANLMDCQKLLAAKRQVWQLGRTQGLSKKNGVYNPGALIPEMMAGGIVALVWW